MEVFKAILASCDNYDRFDFTSDFFQVIAPIYMGNAVTALTKYVAQLADPATRASASMIAFYTALKLMALYFY